MMRHWPHRCRFMKAYEGRCGEPAETPEGCGKHRFSKCVGCGRPATHECTETFSFVCGYELCDSCHHIPGTMSHGPKNTSNEETEDATPTQDPS